MVSRSATRIRPGVGSARVAYQERYKPAGITQPDPPEQFLFLASEELGIGQVVDMLSKKYCEVNNIIWKSVYLSVDEMHDTVGSASVYKEYEFDKLFLMTERGGVEKGVPKTFADSVRRYDYDVNKVAFLIVPDLVHQLGFQGLWALQEAGVKYHSLSKDLLAISAVSYGSVFISHLFYPEVSTTLDHLIVSQYVQKQMKAEIEQVIKLVKEEEQRVEYAEILKQESLTFAALNELIRSLGINEETFGLVSKITDRICDPGTMKEIQASIGSYVR